MTPAAGPAPGAGSPRGGSRHEPGSALEPGLGPFARLRRRRLIRPVADLLRRRLTPFGEGVAALLLVSAAFGRANFDVPAYLVFAFAITVLGGAVLASRRALPEVRASRRPVAPVSAGEVLEVEVDLELPASARRSAHDVGVVELDLPRGLAPVAGHEGGEEEGGGGDGRDVVVCLRPGERGFLRVRLRARKRGAYVLRGLHVASAWPFGLWRALRRMDEETGVLVYPAFRTPEEFSVPEGRNYQPGGILLSSNVGESSEFMHTREYRAGDNLRHLHWASTARLGVPVVKVYHEEYFVRLALVLDTELAIAASDAAFETALSLAAGIADNLSRRDYVIDLFAAGSQVYHFQAGRALAHLDHVLEILACLEAVPEVDWTALAHALAPEAPRLTGVVALFLDWTEERQTLVELIESLGVAVRVIVVREGATTLPAPALPADAFTIVAPGSDLDPAAAAAPGGDRARESRGEALAAGASGAAGGGRR